ncbi:catalase [Nitrincola sp. A-D6]|uniref:catalase family protein n=1 Tax=Nitrincola sp. A-D6 TaxID=1545442 RepID=UPI00051FB172|nr:catalase family protein [Nitrincola sp. A-D6]KGK42113.1 catalase [Nitrincola sp. A-D6]
MFNPIHYSPSVETIGDDESQIVNDILAMMAASQRASMDRHRHAHRDAHSKSHAVLKARLTVRENLPAHLAQGIFSQPCSYEVMVRLSSAPGDIHSDKVPAPRGFAIKVIGVEGERLIPELDGRNQDLLMVNFPVIAFGTVAKYKKLLGLLEKNAQTPDFFQRIVAGTARASENFVEALGKTPGATLQGLARDNNNILGETYHTQAAIRYGAHVAKLSLQPKSDNVRSLTGELVEVDGHSTMRDVVREFFSSDGAEYDLRAQLCVDLDKMPVEDAAVLWEESLAPQESIATLTIDPQDSFSPARRVYGDDVLSFSPWNGIEAHRPLGSIMRVRKLAYERSTAFRHTGNAVERREPDSLDQVPD